MQMGFKSNQWLVIKMLSWDLKKKHTHTLFYLVDLHKIIIRGRAFNFKHTFNVNRFAIFGFSFLYVACLDVFMIYELCIAKKSITNATFFCWKSEGECWRRIYSELSIRSWLDGKKISLWVIESYFEN